MTEADFAKGAHALDRSASDPLWVQLDAELRRRMELGHFVDRFPTDRELMAVYEVSRHTARHSVSQLGSDGILRRSRGVGTSVDRRTFERSLGSLYSLFQVVEENGVPQRSDVRHLALVTDPEAAEQLKLDADAPLVLIDRLRWAGDEPLAIDRIWLPADIAEPLLNADFTHTSLYAELDRTAGVRPNAGWERIHPGIPSADEQASLHLDDGEAVFSIERLGTYSGDPLEWRVTTIRGDRFTLVADWTAGQRNELRPHMLVV